MACALRRKQRAGLEWRTVCKLDASRSSWQSGAPGHYGGKDLKIWSACVSANHRAYTLATVMRTVAHSRRPASTETLCRSKPCSNTDSRSQAWHVGRLRRFLVGRL